MWRRLSFGAGPPGVVRDSAGGRFAPGWGRCAGCDPPSSFAADAAMCPLPEAEAESGIPSDSMAKASR